MLFISFNPIFSVFAFDFFRAYTFLLDMKIFGKVNPILILPDSCAFFRFFFEKLIYLYKSSVL